MADRTAATRAAREASERRWYAEADRQGITDPETREKLAKSARAAEMSRLRLAQLKARRLVAEQGQDDAGDAAAAG